MQKKLTKEYIIGLVDGEGSFTAYVKDPNQNTGKTVRRVSVEPRFYIKLIEKDKDILYALQSYFGCGSVYFQKDTRKNHQHCYRYEVFNREDLGNIIIPFFKENALRFQSKQNDFTLFCEILEQVNAGAHLTKKGLSKIYSLKKKMH